MTYTIPIKSWSTFLLDSFDTVLNMDKKQPFSSYARFGKPQFKFNKKFLTIAGVLLLVALAYYAGGKFSASGENVLGSSFDQRAQAPKAKAKKALNKELLIPIKGDKGDELGKIRYLVESVELQDEILVKGQRARAVAGKTFLIFSIKITNSLNQGAQINTRDYMRLSVNSQKEMLAADIHNDPVQVQAISTKSTRIGFPINDNDKNITIYLGEIKGQKETIKLSF